MIESVLVIQAINDGVERIPKEVKAVINVFRLLNSTNKTCLQMSNGGQNTSR